MKPSSEIVLQKQVKKEFDKKLNCGKVNKYPKIVFLSNEGKCLGTFDYNRNKCYGLLPGKLKTIILLNRDGNFISQSDVTTSMKLF